MKRKTALLLLAGMLGAFAGSWMEARAQTRQCYYRPDIDPPNSCTACADTCMGQGYLCCEIIIRPAPGG